MRVLRAEDGVDLDDILLPFQSFQIVGNGHQVRLRRQFVGAVPPVGVLEGAEPAGAGKCGNLILDALEISRTRLGPV